MTIPPRDSLAKTVTPEVPGGKELADALPEGDLRVYVDPKMPEAKALQTLSAASQRSAIAGGMF